jgi:hypothetical protein
MKCLSFCIFKTRKPRSKKIWHSISCCKTKSTKLAKYLHNQILEWLESRFVCHLSKFLSLWIINVNMNSNFVPKSIKLCQYLLTLTQILELSKSRFVCHLSKFLSLLVNYKSQHELGLVRNIVDLCQKACKIWTCTSFNNLSYYGIFQPFMVHGTWY